jgi:DNA mismatch repair protein MutS
VVLGTAGPRDIVALGRSCAIIPAVKQVLCDAAAPLLKSLSAQLDELADIRDLVSRTLIDEPPALTREGGFTRDGLDPEIDELRTISRSGRQVIADMETAERTRTGISSLKVRFNRVFGYYIEISKANLHLAPADYERKQTIAGGERFSTPALRDYEAKILGADERILARELDVFDALRRGIAGEAARIQASARALAAVDALAGLAETAVLRNYTKPHVHDGDDLVATDVRHPVVEPRVSGGFVPNDVDLNGSTRHLVILTGPNMGGKSTYLRQTALLPVLAQMGSFVPARDAKLPVVDRIYARVGASDNIARGQSTFMVEMQETANILHTATSRSLIVLDEIGRGTSTFDGLSIAWAVAEHLAGHPEVRPKTLFATHYHELTDLADNWPGVVNAHVAAREWKDDIVFLRKILPGRADRSYGIQVARLAGLPASVIARAQEILRGLERDELSRGGRPALTTSAGASSRQLGLFADGAREWPFRHRAEALVARLLALDLDGTSPREALTMLGELQQEAASDDPIAP